MTTSSQRRCEDGGNGGAACSAPLCSRLLALPPDALSLVLACLGPLDTAAVSCACAYLRRVASAPPLLGGSESSQAIYLSCSSLAHRHRLPAHFARLRNVRRLTLICAEASACLLEWALPAVAAQMPFLEHLRLQPRAAAAGGGSRGAPGASGAAAAAQPELPLSAAVLAAIARCGRLRELELHGFALRDGASFQALAPCVTLRRLDISRPGGCDPSSGSFGATSQLEGVSALAGLEELLLPRMLVRIGGRGAGTSPRTAAAAHLLSAVGGLHCLRALSVGLYIDSGGCPAPPTVVESLLINPLAASLERIAAGSSLERLDLQVDGDVPKCTDSAGTHLWAALSQQLAGLRGVRLSRGASAESGLLAPLADLPSYGSVTDLDLRPPPGATAAALAGHTPALLVPALEAALARLPHLRSLRCSIAVDTAPGALGDPAWGRLLDLLRSVPCLDLHLDLQQQLRAGERLGRARSSALVRLGSFGSAADGSSSDDGSGGSSAPSHDDQPQPNQAALPDAQAIEQILQSVARLPGLAALGLSASAIAGGSAAHLAAAVRFAAVHCAHVRSLDVAGDLSQPSVQDALAEVPALAPGIAAFSLVHMGQAGPEQLEAQQPGAPESAEEVQAAARRLLRAAAAKPAWRALSLTCPQLGAQQLRALERCALDAAPFGSWLGLQVGPASTL